MDEERPIPSLPPQPDFPHSFDTIPLPVLLNTWKHHAESLRRRIARTATAGATALAELANELIVVGSDLMDLYTGIFSPAEIAHKVLDSLRPSGHLLPDEYRTWLAEGGGYQVVVFPEDSSRWVLRLGEESGRYIHVHPARWAPQTLRVRANVLKTAVMVLAHIAVHGGDPLDVGLLNRVRQQYLGFSPIGRLKGDQGLRAVIALLRPT
jgi:hypothetical protein